LAAATAAAGTQKQGAQIRSTVQSTAATTSAARICIICAGPSAGSGLHSAAGRPTRPDRSTTGTVRTGAARIATIAAITVTGGTAATTGCHAEGTTQAAVTRVRGKCVIATPTATGTAAAVTAASTATALVFRSSAIAAAAAATAAASLSNGVAAAVVIGCSPPAMGSKTIA
jgi:hypothetical protein